MAFSDFVYPEVLKQLGLTMNTSLSLFGQVPSLPASTTLQAVMEINVPLATSANTEAARSAWIVAPLLSDLWSRYRGRINLHSGLIFAADPDSGLTGYCDYMIGRAQQQPRIVAPVVVIFEAKRDSIMDSLGQCIAGMVGAARFNQREGTAVETVYGVGTTGSLWQFLQLEGSVLTLDLTEYNLSQVDRLLGILAHMVGPIPGAVAA